MSLFTTVSKMPRHINVFTSEQDYEWIKAVLETLANDVITDEEAGQRGAKLSKMIVMISTAYSGNASETTRLMQEIKRLTTLESRHGE